MNKRKEKMKKKYGYCASVGSYSKYGMSVPISRQRAIRLIRNYGTGRQERRSAGLREVFISVCPLEVRFAYNHGADGLFRVTVWLA